MRTINFTCVIFFLCIEYGVFNCVSAEIYTSTEMVHGTLQHLRQLTLYEDIQEIMVKYVMHFEFSETMTIETPTGEKKINRDDNLMEFNKFLIHAAIELETMRRKVFDATFKFDYPVQAFRFVRNNTLVIKKILNKMRSTFEKQQDVERAGKVEAIINSWNSNTLPTVEDLTGTMQVIIDLQKIYSLKSSEIADGGFLGDHSEVLTAEECTEIAQLAQKQDNKISHISWLETARRKVETRGDTSIKKSSLYSMLIDAYESVGCQCMPEAVAVRNTLNDKHLHMTGNMDDQCHGDRDDTCIHKLVRINRSSKNENFDSNFRHLCKSVTQPQSMDQLNRVHTDKTLSCYYENTQDLFHLIRPFKVEILHREPTILLIHELLEKSWTELLIHHGISKLQAEHTANQTMYMPYKTRARSIELKSGRQLQLISSIQKQMSRVINMDLKSFGKLYLTNYGIGGFDIPHIEGSADNSLATMTLFLNDVKVGGDIVFPHLGLSVKTNAMSALLVYTMNQNGTGSIKSLHGACPVVKGNKWIATQTIGQYNNELK